MAGTVRRHTSMRGRLAILLVAVLVLPLVGVAWWSHTSLRGELSANSSDDRLSVASQATLDAALMDLRTRLRDELGDVALRLAYTTPDASDPGAAFEDLPEALRPRWLARVTASGAQGLPVALREALAAELAADQPVRGWRCLPLPEGEALCEVVVQPCVGGRLVAVRPLEPVLADLTFADRLERVIVLPDGARLAAGQRSGPDGSADLPPETLPDLWAQASADAADGDFGPAQRRLPDGLLGALPLATPLGEPAALAVVHATDAVLHPLLERREALVARSAAGVGWLAAAGVLLALGIGLLAPRFIWSDIRESTDFITSSVARLHELVSRIGVALAEQAGVLENLSASVGQLGSESREIAQTSQALSHSAEQSEWVSQSGHQKAESAQRAVLDMRGRVDEIDRQMQELGRRCEAIGEILVYLDHLTTETTAVSVNATIQAAGATGTGRQLAAMAGEIQKLAELALGSTREIRQLVEEIQDAAGAAQGAMRDGREQVERCLSAFEDVEQNFGSILRWVEDTKRSARGIVGSTASQSVSLQSVGGDVTAIGQRSRETSANFDAVVDASNELAELGQRMKHTWRVG